MRTSWLFAGVGVAWLSACATAPRSEPAASASASASVALAPAPSDVAVLDALLEKAWAGAKLTPSPPVDDATYLRRVSLDLAGRIASEDELRAFLSDTSPDKRARAVERLLASPAHDAHLARRWEQLLLGPEVRSPVVDRGALRRWLEARFREGVPWSQMARELIAAEGTSSLGGKIGPGLTADDPARGEQERAAGVNGATNFTLRFAKSPADLGGHVARTFLGVELQCAQCHDHKTEAWKQDDYRAFSSALLRLSFENEARDKGMLRVITLENAARPPRQVRRDEAAAAIVAVAPRSLDGEALGEDDPRAAMAAWITATHNPWFRRAAVNRVWAELFGQGLVEPVSDLRPSNPPVLPEVLDALEQMFARSGDDLDAIYRVLTATKAYELGVVSAEGSPREQLFSRAALRPLSSDALVDSIFVATELDRLLEERAPERAPILEARLRRKLGFVFDADAESNGEASEGTLRQALFTMNGVLATAASTLTPDGELASLVRGRSDEEAIESLWLRFLGRGPSAEELARALRFVREAPPKRDDTEARASPAPGLGRVLRSAARDERERAYEDLIWALLNSHELHFRR